MRDFTMLKHIILTMVGVLMSAQASLAADRSEVNLIGYSEGGAYFAFEEFGIQDGSGFSYSTIFVIDVAADKWVAGAPFHYQADDETTSLAQARGEAFSLAQPALTSLAISYPAQFLAYQAIGEATPVASELEFNVPGHTGVDAMWGDYKLEISLIDLPTGSNCDGLLEESQFLYADTNKVPTSRGCPITYRISGIVVPYQDFALTHSIALISVWSFGFEGPDRRFIAVPFSYGG
jgi:predicted secreted protein